MISHKFLSRLTSCSRLPGGATIARAVGAGPACVRAAWSAGYGPLRVAHNVAARLQGARVDSGLLPRAAQSRRLQRRLLLSGARPSCDRRRRECVDGGDRSVDHAVCLDLRKARAVRSGARWYQRDAQDRPRRARAIERQLEASCWDYRGGDVCRSRPQVSDLGGGSVPERTRASHPKGAQIQRRGWLPVGGAECAWSTGMMAGSDGFAVAGGPALHIPVLGRRAVEFLNIRDGGVYIDATFGAGGYTRAMLAAADCKVIGIDRDPSAIALGADLVRQAGDRLVLVEGHFSALDAIVRDCGYETVDGVVLDVGVSSMQLDQASRGFSFRLDGPLDMRMSGQGLSAADIVNTASERDLANIIFLRGEERHSRSVARAIVKARRLALIRTTFALADIVASAVRARPGDIHPATRTFQALRIFVNGELQ